MNSKLRAVFERGHRAIERFFGAQHAVLDQNKDVRANIQGIFHYRTRTLQVGSTFVNVREPTLLVNTCVMRKVKVDVGSILLITNEQENRECFQVFEVEPRITGQSLLVLKLRVEEEEAMNPEGMFI